MANNTYDTRRTNLRQLMAEWGGPTSLALKLGHANGSFLSQIVGPHPTRKISEDVARGIEKKLKLPERWLDQEHAGVVGGEAPQPQPLQGDLLASVTKACLSAVQDNGGRPSIEKVAECIAIAYKHAVDTGRVDLDFIRQLLKLLK